MKLARLSLNSMPDYLIEDYWVEILLRLPVGSLCRFRSVCKSWNRLISSQFFIDLHRSFTRSIAAAVYNLRSDIYFPFEFRAHVPYDDSCQCINIVDVISGLICISYSLNSTFDSTIIWNPAIHRYITLPHLPFPSHIDSVLTRWTLDHPEEEEEEEEETNLVGEIVHFFSNGIGFGYDRSRDDFMVVRIWLNDPFFHTRVGFIPTTYEVYSTRQGKWRLVITESINSWLIHFEAARIGCFVDGKIHWVVSSYHEFVNRVLVFDCETQELTTMAFPQELYEPKATWTSPSKDPVSKAELLEYGGMLSLMVLRYWEQRTELWAIDKGGQWNKLFAVDNKFDLLKTYEPSFLEMASNGGPRQWIKFNSHVDSFHQVYAYKETMLLMDEPQAESYSANDTIEIFIPADKYHTN